MLTFILLLIALIIPILIVRDQLLGPSDHFRTFMIAKGSYKSTILNKWRWQLTDPILLTATNRLSFEVLFGSGCRYVELPSTLYGLKYNKNNSVVITWQWEESDGRIIIYANDDRLDSLKIGQSATITINLSTHTVLCSKTLQYSKLLTRNRVSVQIRGDVWPVKLKLIPQVTQPASYNTKIFIKEIK